MHAITLIVNCYSEDINLEEFLFATINKKDHDENYAGKIVLNQVRRLLLYKLQIHSLPHFKNRWITNRNLNKAEKYLKFIDQQAIILELLGKNFNTEILSHLMISILFFVF